MAKKNTEVVVVANVPTPLGPDDLMVPPGMKLVKEADYDKLLEISQQLIDQKKVLRASNDEYKADITTMVSCLVALAPLVGGGGGFTPANIMKLMQNKDKLAAGMQPMFEVIQKYTTPAPAAQLAP